MHRRVVLLALGVALVSAGVSSATAQAAEEPSLSAAFDSAAVVTALAALPVPVGERSLLELRFDSTGTFTGAELVGPAVPAEYVRAVEAALRPHSRVLPPRAGGYGLTAVLAGGSSAIFAAPSVQAAPSLANERALRQAMSRLARTAREEADWEVGIAPGMPGPPPGSPAPTRRSGVHRMELRFRVLADGTVAPASVSLRRSSGRPRVDAETLRMAEKLRFHPARVDGQAVPAYVILPVTVPY